MADRSKKEITSIDVGEETRGGTVLALMKFLPESIYNYKGVKVSGSHWVIEDNQFIEVENSKRAVATDTVETVYCFKTSKNRIWVNGVEFGDFETGSDEDWSPHFEFVKQKLHEPLRETGNAWRQQKVYYQQELRERHQSSHQVLGPKL